MRRGPAIGGHLPRVSKTVLEQMPRDQRIVYHRTRSEIYGKRAAFFTKVSLVFAVIAVAALIARLALGLS